MIGSLDSTDAICRIVANRAGCKAVSVDYRPAPEHRFPTPFDDCYAALRAMHDNGVEL